MAALLFEFQGWGQWGGGSNFFQWEVGGGPIAYSYGSL